MYHIFIFPFILHPVDSRPVPQLIMYWCNGSVSVFQLLQFIFRGFTLVTLTIKIFISIYSLF